MFEETGIGKEDVHNRLAREWWYCALKRALAVW